MKKGLRLGLLMTLLVLPFMWSTSFAKEVPIKISYTGALVPIPVNLSGSLTSATVMDAQSHGTFGASMSHVVTEWLEVPDTKCDGDYADYNYYYLMHASSVITFSNDDQLYGAGAIWDSGMSGWMCLNPADGHFVGEAKGDFTGGTGRFEGATGTFTAPFRGYNLTGFAYGYGSGPIQGTFEGKVSLQ